jgi:syntaxin-binding protein 1
MPTAPPVLTLPDIERLEERRTTQRDMDAIYIITPKAHIVDCIMAEFDQRRYRGFFLIWTTCKRSSNEAARQKLTL